MTLTLINLFFVSVTAFAGWAIHESKWVSRDHEKQVGVIEYLDQGADSLIERRREDAGEKMDQFCGDKKFKIVREISGSKEYGGSRDSGPSVAIAVQDGNSTKTVTIKFGSGRSEVPLVANYNYIVFKCEPRKKPTRA